MPDLRRVVVPLFAGYVALFAVLLHTSGRTVPLRLLASSSLVFVLLVAVLATVRWTPQRLALVILAGAAVLQVVALTHGPTTSDDVYRYLWDGRVQFSGTDPYAHPPVSAHLAHLRDSALFQPARAHCQWPIPGGCSLINRPSVRTIYPPVAQLIFDAGHVLSFGAGGIGGVHTFQVLAAAGVLGVTVLLLRAGLRADKALWPVAVWAWSPLVVLEYGNNAHVDWAAVLFALGCLELARRGRAGWTGLLLAAATLTKIYPALIGAAVLRRRPWTVLTVAAGTVVLAYVPHVLAAGTDVIGYLPGYLHEEGYNSGTRLLLLGAVLPHPVDTVLGLLIIAAVAGWTWWHADPEAPERGAVVLVGVTFLVTTPSYGWYAGLLLALAVVARRLEWVPVVAAPAFVYLVHAEVSKESSYGTTIYAVAGGLTLVGALLRVRVLDGRPAPTTGGVQMSSSVVLTWTGDVDLANITPIRHELDEALNAPGVEQVVIDLGAVGFVDSLGLGMLVYAVNTARTRGIALSVRHIPDRTRQLIDVAGLSDVLTIENV